MKSSYFYMEARQYQNFAKAYGKEAMWALDMLLNDPENWYWKDLALSMQEKAAMHYKEANHYLMLAIDPAHYIKQRKAY